MARLFCMKHILHIDDDAFYAHTLKRAFERAGYAVTHAHHGEEGIELATAHAPDVILLDIVMPKKNGFEVLSELQARKTTKQIPVIMLTHLGAKEDVIHCLELGASSYLIKTHHTVSDIVSHVERIVQERSRSRKKGFTSLELLFVLGAILVAGAFGYGLYRTRTFHEIRLRNETVLERYQQALNIAQSNGWRLERCSATEPDHCRICERECVENENKLFELITPATYRDVQNIQQMNVRIRDAQR